jgi:multidrug efflux pump subunit AcrB
MTFIPLLGYYLLRAPKKPAPSMEERSKRGFAGFYFRVGGWALRRRWWVLAGAVVLLAGSALLGRSIKQEFFPKDYSYLAFVDVWLPAGSTLESTDEAARQVERVLREVSDEYSRSHPGEGGRPREILQSMTTFVGGGGPRFWMSVSPELQQINYAQLVFQVKDSHDTGHLIAPMQRAVTARVPGARVDVRQLETNPVGIPVAVRLSGHDIPTLRMLAEKAKSILRAIPEAERIRDDWAEENLGLRLRVEPDRANLAGVTNWDVASSAASAMNGYRVSSVREGHEEIPVLARLRLGERAQLSDVQNLYVYSSRGAQKVPLRQVSSIEYKMEPETIRRRNQFRTITVSSFAAAGALPSDVLTKAQPKLEALAKSLPPGYRLEIGGEKEEQDKSFAKMVIVLGISIFLIFLALVLQFRNVFKPLIVFAAIPFGMIGAFSMLALAGAPFGFMAFLGAISLIGVIVSHVIVLFDFIEEARERGMPLQQALLEAGIVRLRPVLITVGATVLGLVPLLHSGGPLWEPLCFLHIGGLSLATVVTLLLVPVLYMIFVKDLKLVKWEAPKQD